MSTATQADDVLDVDLDEIATHAPRGSHLPWLLSMWGIAAVSLLAILLLDVSNMTVGVLSMVLLVSLLLAGLHIGLSMIAASAVSLWTIAGPTVVGSTLMDAVYYPAASWQLSVVPMYIFMGVALWKSGLTGKAFDSAKLWLGRMPGGLAIATNAAGAGFAAASGSTVAITYAIGRVAIPEMLRAKYDARLATGIASMSGVVGSLIPPSVLLVIYAGVAQTSVGHQLLAGVVPGLALAVVFGIVIVVWAVLRPDVAPRADMTGVTFRDKVRSLSSVIPVVAIILVVIGGLLFGVFTPTESGAFGALAALVVGWTARQTKGKRSFRDFFKFFGEIVKSTVTSTAGIFLLFVGIAVLTRSMALSQLTQNLTDAIIGANFSPVVFLLILMGAYLIMGMFLDGMSMMLLTVPLLIGPLLALDISLLWFGIFMVMMIEIGSATPPVGMLPFIIHQIVQDKDVSLGQKISLVTVFKGAAPFVIGAILFCLLLIFVPEIATWLPEISSAKG